MSLLLVKSGTRPPCPRYNCLLSFVSMLLIVSPLSPPRKTKMPSLSHNVPRPNATCFNEIEPKSKSKERNLSIIPK
jgi:hypothetical protein